MKEITSPIRLLIADDHLIFREGFNGLFKKQQNISLVGQASNGKELLEAAELLSPDVIITDIKMPEMDGICATAQLTKSKPNIKVIALSMFNDDHLILDMLEAGARGYLLKNAHKDDIMEAITAVHRGDVYYCKETSVKLVRLMAKSKADVWATDRPPIFTVKEKEVIRFICEGCSNQEISDGITLSIRTVEGYRKRIYEKMKVRNTAGVVVFAIRNGIYDL